MNTYYVYKYEKEHEIVYIGQSINLKNRIRQHEKEIKFQPYLNSEIYYFECNSKIEMDSYEYFLINKYHPILNQAYNYQNKVFDISEPEWQFYNKETFGNKIDNHHYPINLSLLKEIKIDKPNSVFTQLGVFEQKILIYMFLKCSINNIDFNKDIPFSIPVYLKETGYYNNSGKLYSDCEKVRFINKIGKGEYIFNFPENITNSPLFSYPIQIINLFNQIKCKYTIPLFELISCNKNKKINRDQLIDFLSPNTKSYRNNFRDFQKRILLKALNEINSILKCNYTYEQIYTGRKVTDLIFTLLQEQQISQ